MKINEMSLDFGFNRVQCLIAALLMSIQTYSPLNAVGPKQTEKFHLVTVSSDEPVGRMSMLIESCKNHGIKPVILGVDQPYYANQTKLYHMRNYLKLLPKDDIVLFVDAFDTLVLADKQTITDRFLAMNVPILMSAEKNCFPRDLLSKYPADTTTSPFKYLNSGTYIGYAGALLDWLENMTIDLKRNDQGAVTEFYLGPKNRNSMVLDKHCTLFLCLVRVSDDEVVIDPVQKTVYCLPTSSFPCVLHANGKSFPIYDKVYEALIKDSANQFSRLHRIIRSIYS